MTPREQFLQLQEENRKLRQESLCILWELKRSLRDTQRHHKRAMDLIAQYQKQQIPPIARPF